MNLLSFPRFLLASAATLLTCSFLSLPVSASISNVFFGIAVATFLLHFALAGYGEFVNAFSIAKLMGGLLLVIVLAALVNDTFSIGLRATFKYIEFFLIPIFIVIFQKSNKSNFETIISSYLIVIVLTLLLSYLLYFGFDLSYLNKYFRVRLGDSTNPTVFRAHITYGVFIAFAAILILIRALDEGNFFYKTLLWLFFGASVINVILMVQGRTGYLVLITGFAWVLFKKVALRKFLLTVFVMACLGGSLTMFKNNFSDRMRLGFNEVSEYSLEPANTSMGLRAEFLRVGVEIFSSAPVINKVIGYGFGSFSDVYRSYAQGKQLTESVNPHNQYLLFLIELGIVGLMLWLLILLELWKSARQLPFNQSIWVQTVLLTYLFASLFNSMLLDSAEGLFFALAISVAYAGGGARK